MTPSDVVAVQTVVSAAAVVAFAVIAQRERVKREILAEAVVDAHKWVDEIIEALKNPDQGEGDRSLDRLVAQFDDGVGPVPDQREGG